MTKEVSVYQSMANFDQAMLKALEECRRGGWNPYNITVTLVDVTVKGWRDETSYTYNFSCEFDGEDE